MKIAIIGYGKMGKVIERLAEERGHSIAAKFSSSFSLEDNLDSLKKADVAIEFTRPELAVKHINLCIEHQVPVVVGTTGWGSHLPEVSKHCENNSSALLHASNFSIGVNLFFELNQKLAQLMSTNGQDYQVSMEEIHHTQKLDAPSGTAISLADQLVENKVSSGYRCIESNEELQTEVESRKEFVIQAKRIPEVPGTHIIKYQSPIDDIEITHRAHNREGFALGSIVAAEWLVDKQGVFTMKDVLNFA